MARRFEFIGGTSAKFWTINVVGKDVTVCFGRIGSVGVTQIKSFPYESQANSHVAKMIAEKLGKGYHEVGTAVSKTPAAIKIPAVSKAPAAPAPAQPVCRSKRHRAKRIINVAADNIEPDPDQKES